MRRATPDRRISSAGVGQGPGQHQRNHTGTFYGQGESFEHTARLRALDRTGKVALQILKPHYLIGGNVLEQFGVVGILEGHQHQRSGKPGRIHAAG